MFLRMPWRELDEERNLYKKDLRLLIRILKIKTVEEGIDIVKKYYPEKLIPQRTYYALDELINTALVDNGVES